CEGPHLRARREHARRTEEAYQAPAPCAQEARHMSAKPRVGLFVTCLVDLVRPRIGFAAAKLIEQSGCEVVVPQAQTCCGQPAWNAGADKHAREIAEQVIAAFNGFDYVVAPSGSCAGMIKRHYPEVLNNDPRALALAAKT